MEYRNIHTQEADITTDSWILDDGTISNSVIRITANVKVHYLFLPRENGNYTRTFFLVDGCQFQGAAILYRTDIESQMTIHGEGADIQANLSILALAQSHARLSMSGVGTIASGSTNITLRVDQTNILLGESAIVRGMPVLNVGTDSIEGGHSCRVHRIAGEALFYLQSHGLDAKTAEGMLLESEIRRHVEVMTPESEPFVQSILQTLLIP